MFHPNKTYRIGDTTVTKIDELRLNVAPPAFLYPAWEASELDRNLPWMTPGNMDAETGHLIQSVHSWLVRTPHHTILIDTGSGNGKERPRNPIFHRLETPYLARLAAAGVRPEEVDFVLHTHLHVDHVGWNTHFQEGRWIPTFPNARHVFPAAEEAYYASPVSHNDVNIPSIGVYEDSIAPLILAGQTESIGEGGGDYLDHFTFRPTKGHSIGHMSIELKAQGQTALFSGDVMHHPLQVVRPDWNSVFCEWAEDAKRSRQWVLEEASDREMLVFTPHFAESSAGFVKRRGNQFQWQYE